MSRQLYETLTEFGWVQDPVTRKKLSQLLDAEGVQESELRARLIQLRRIDSLLAVLSPKRKLSKGEQRREAQRVIAEQNAEIAAAVDLAFVRERVNADGVPAEQVAAQVGWPVEKVLAACDPGGLS